MKTAMHGKILAIVAAAMIAMAAADDAALARGSGGFGGGHIGGFGGAHMGVAAGPRAGNFGVGHMGGLGVHPMGMPGLAMDRGLGASGIGRTRVSHELEHRHFRDLYGASPLYDDNDCSWPADLTIESCPVGSAAE
jgi:hypothetical protein